MGYGPIILKLVYVYIRIEEIGEVITDNESHVTEKVTNRERGKARMKPMVLGCNWRYS